MKNKKRNRVFLLLILILAISIGFALLSTTLKINGNTGIGKNTWDVHWANVGDVQKSDGAVIRDNGAAKVDTSDNTLVTFNVKLNQPGDFYEFQVDAVNAGTLDAMVQVLPSITVSGDGTTLPDYLKFTVKYADGGDIEQYHLLAKAEDLTSTPKVYTTERYKVRLEFSTDVDEEDLAEIDTKNEYIINLESPYIQADEHAFDRHGLKLGDYFTLVPDKATATTNTPGFSGSISTADQTLWRVIDIKENGQVDAVTEYTSTSTIGIGGIDGYRNYIAGLQDIASCYAKEGYTVATRMMGYDGQTLVLPNSTVFEEDIEYFASIDSTPYAVSSVYPYFHYETGQEYDGGVFGDTLYIKDCKLVSNVYISDTATYGVNGLGASDKTGKYWYKEYYWLASRHYDYWEDEGGMVHFGGNYIYRGAVYEEPVYWHNGEEWGEDIPNRRVRPIITIKKGLTIASGTGTKADPYIFD